MPNVYLGLGTNLGDKDRNLRRAVGHLQKKIGNVLSLSSFYETAPWGFVSEHSFLNAVACLETELAPADVLRRTQEIEKEMGRTHKSVDNVYTDRLIDIDLLLYDGQILDSHELVLPHPYLAQRRFVLEPLCEIAPTLRHPVLGKTIRQLLEELEQQG